MGLGKNMVMVDSDEVWSRYVEVFNTKLYFVLTYASSLSSLIFCVFCRLTRMHVPTGTR